MLNNCIKNMLNLFFPTPCQLCDRLLSQGERICSLCQADLPYNHSPCQRCGTPLASTSQQCGQCVQYLPEFDVIHALFRYEKPVDVWIQQLKFNGRLHIAPLLAELFIEHFFTRLQNADLQWIIPVPLHKRRLSQRGFNQSTELARPLARRLGLPLKINAVQRIRATEEQSALNARQRISNVKNAFAWRHKDTPHSVLLVDDVMTTGQTMNSLCRTLKSQGVKVIHAAVFGRA